MIFRNENTIHNNYSSNILHQTLFTKAFEREKEKPITNTNLLQKRTFLSSQNLISNYTILNVFSTCLFTVTKKKSNEKNKLDLNISIWMRSTENNQTILISNKWRTNEIGSSLFQLPQTTIEQKKSNEKRNVFSNGEKRNWERRILKTLLYTLIF